MTTRLWPTYKCRFCGEKFDDGYPYDHTQDAIKEINSFMNLHPIHKCNRGHIGIGDFVGFERVFIND